MDFVYFRLSQQEVAFKYVHLVVHFVSTMIICTIVKQHVEIRRHAKDELILEVFDASWKETRSSILSILRSWSSHYENIAGIDPLNCSLSVLFAKFWESPC